MRRSSEEPHVETTVWRESRARALGAGPLHAEGREIRSMAGPERAREENETEAVSQDYWRV